MAMSTSNLRNKDGQVASLGASQETDKQEETSWKQFIADLLSVDIITAKGNILVEVEDSTFIAKATPKANGEENEIQILARTIMEFGGDQLMIIPTHDGKADGGVSGSLNQEIWNLHMQNVTTALQRRRDNLDTINGIIEIVLKNFPKSEVPKIMEMQATMKRKKKR